MDKSIQVWTGPLTRNKVLILALDELANTITVNLSLSKFPGLTSGQFYFCREIWVAKSLGRVKGTSYCKWTHTKQEPSLSAKLQRGARRKMASVCHLMR
jgi:hypothetical protein